MSNRLRGAAHRALLPRLPRNLVLFDGHCLMCQARAQYVLERNFSFFGFYAFLTRGEDPRARAGLDRHRLFFASLDSPEATYLTRTFFRSSAKVPTQSSSSSSPAATSGKEDALQLPEELVLLFIEKVPSQRLSFLRGIRKDSNEGDPLFTQPSADGSGGTAGSSSALRKRRGSDVDTASLSRAENADLIVSVNFTAMCRVGVHLDRLLPRLLFRCIWVCVPTKLGDAWFKKYVCERRRTMWGTSEVDAVRTDGKLIGIAERRWTLRGVSVNQRV